MTMRPSLSHEALKDALLKARKLGHRGAKADPEQHDEWLDAELDDEPCHFPGDCRFPSCPQCSSLERGERMAEREGSVVPRR